MSNNKADQFTALHIPGQPLVLYNIWDAGSAIAVAATGAPAIATGSASVAAAQGFADGQQLPLPQLLACVERICATVDLPLSVDFEGGYAEQASAVTANVTELLELPIAGVNFEDQIVGQSQIYSIDQQVERIAAMRGAADEKGVKLFINARTDLFLMADPASHEPLLEEAIERARHYQQAGASGFFAPGLVDERLIERLCTDIQLPLNIMMKPGMPSIAQLAELGVARVSHGPYPYFELMEQLGRQAELANKT